jgi:hypothetical protein
MSLDVLLFNLRTAAQARFPLASVVTPNEPADLDGSKWIHIEESGFHSVSFNVHPSGQARLYDRSHACWASPDVLRDLSSNGTAGLLSLLVEADKLRSKPEDA